MSKDATVIPILKSRPVSPVVHGFASAEETAEALALEVAARLREAIEIRGKASLVVSGGSTPQPFFAVLSQQVLAWEKVWITLADERWVPVNDKRSNEKMVRQHLVRGEAKQAKLVSLVNPAGAAKDAGLDATVEAANAQLQTLFTEPFDVVVLGMGDDGHTASLFPHHPVLETARAQEVVPSCVAVRGAPKPPMKRITFTPASLLHAHHVMLHITGKAKMDSYKRAMADKANIEAFPINLLLNNDKLSVQTYWAAL